VHQYLKEIVTCWRLGERWHDRLRLAIAGLEFHVANLLRFPPASAASTFRIGLNGQREINLRRRSGDVFIFHEIFTSLCYEVPAQFAPAGSRVVIVDLGANIGLTTLFLAARFPDATHICVEPNPSNVELLRRNLSFLGKRLTVLEAAASRTAGEARFTDSAWSWGGHLVDQGPATRSVRSITVDQILCDFGITDVGILKVDIEGAEQQVFCESPAWLRHVGCVVIELHNGYSIDDFRRDVEPMGLAVLDGGSEWGNSMLIAVPAASLCPNS
jgi:FkbM family methyltransferase